jgi:hypothetical protein
LDTWVEFPIKHKMKRGMLSFGMLCHVALVRTDISEKYKVFLCSMRRLLVTANIPSSPTLVTLMMEALSSTEMSVLTRALWHNISEDSLHSYCRENLKS